MAEFKIAVLISGGGTTLRNLIEKKTAGLLDAEIVQVISSNPTAGGIEFANRASIPVGVVERKDFVTIDDFSEAIFSILRNRCDLVVMGGFLKKIKIPNDFQNRVINIHPSLIPAFCGKGFYGLKVHQAVLDFGCKITGCTIHVVDDEYDHGPIISQRAVEVYADDDAQTLARRVFEVECEEYPQVINQLALQAKSQFQM